MRCFHFENGTKLVMLLLISKFFNNFFTKKMKISNDTTIYQRIKEVLKYEKISVNCLSKTFDMVQTTLNKQLRGDTPLPITTFILVISVLSDSISLDWLLTGEGSMIKGDVIQEKALELPSDNAEKGVITELRTIIKDQAKEIARKELELERLRSTDAATATP